MITDEIRKLIVLQADSTEIKKAAIAAGMKTLRQDALEKVYSGITSIEAMQFAINVEEDSAETTE